MTVPSRAAPSQEFRMSVFEYQGCVFSYWLSGPPKAPLVVFTPGAFADHTMFDAQVDVVCQRYRMLRWDARGHGRSWPSSLPFTTMQAAAGGSRATPQLAGSSPSP